MHKINEMTKKSYIFDACILCTIDNLSEKYPFAINFKNIIPNSFIHEYITDELLDKIIIRQKSIIKKYINSKFNKKYINNKFIFFYYKECIKVSTESWMKFVHFVNFVNSIGNNSITLVELVELNENSDCSDHLNTNNNNLFSKRLWKFDELNRKPL